MILLYIVVRKRSFFKGDLIHPLDVRVSAKPDSLTVNNEVMEVMEGLLTHLVKRRDKGVYRRCAVFLLL